MPASSPADGDPELRRVRCRCDASPTAAPWTPAVPQGRAPSWLLRAWLHLHAPIASAGTGTGVQRVRVWPLLPASHVEHCMSYGFAAH